MSDHWRDDASATFSETLPSRVMHVVMALARLPRSVSAKHGYWQKLVWLECLLRLVAAAERGVCISDSSYMHD